MGGLEPNYMTIFSYYNMFIYSGGATFNTGP